MVPAAANKKQEESKMPERNAENNRVSVIGVVVSGFEFSHEVFGESFYIMELSVNRLSNGSNRTVSFL